MEKEGKKELAVLKEVIVPAIKAKVKELNDLLVEVKKDPAIRASLGVHGVTIKSVGIVNQVTLELVKTQKL